jgi:hypothetical protein
MKELKRKFSAEGFERYETVLGGEGAGLFGRQCSGMAPMGKAGKRLISKSLRMLSVSGASNNWLG